MQTEVTPPSHLNLSQSTSAQSVLESPIESFVCRSCGGTEVLPVLSLGRTPLANALLSDPEQISPEYPLDLAFCSNCALVQLTTDIPPETLFSDYRYFSSYSDTMLMHAENLAHRMILERELTPEDLVVELASNDGYLLKNYKASGIQVLGVEPAQNVAAVAIAAGIPTRTEFFDEKCAELMVTEGMKAKVIHAHNVLAHVPDPQSFVRGIERLLAFDGVAVLEFPYLLDLLDRCAFDTIYHEHLSYFSLASLWGMFNRNGLRIFDVERLPIHGGSLRLFVDKQTGEPGHQRVQELWALEQSRALNRTDTYLKFAAQTTRVRDELRELLYRLRAEGRTIAAYGAAAKGSTLLNYMGIGRDVIDFVVDRSPHKQGCYMPGVKIPILAPDTLLKTQPDYTLLLTWNFAREILHQQKIYRARGGRFILPVPEPRVLNRNEEL